MSIQVTKLDEGILATVGTLNTSDAFAYKGAPHLVLEVGKIDVEVLRLPECSKTRMPKDIQVQIVDLSVSWKLKVA